jgi:hypothetical protein
MKRGCRLACESGYRARQSRGITDEPTPIPTGGAEDIRPFV